MAEIDLPLVVDNPTKGLDKQASVSVNSSLPNAFGQCCYLVYPSEGANLGAAQDAAVDFATIHPKDDDDGVQCTHGREFFNTYDNLNRVEG